MEIAIKVSLGKLQIEGRWQNLVKREMTASGIRWLPIGLEHCVEVSNLPFHHRDPFDRLLAAQALAERYALLRRDAVYDAYRVRRVW